MNYKIKTTKIKDEYNNSNDYKYIIEKLQYFFGLQIFECEISFYKDFVFDTVFEGAKDFIMKYYVLTEIVERDIETEIELENEKKFLFEIEAKNWYKNLTEREKEFVKLINRKKLYLNFE